MPATSPEALQRLLQRCREEDYVTLLGLTQPVVPAAVEAAVGALRQQLAALGPEAAQPAAVAEIVTTLADAEATLRCPLRGPRYASRQERAAR